MYELCIINYEVFSETREAKWLNNCRYGWNGMLPDLDKLLHTGTEDKKYLQYQYICIYIYNYQDLIKK